MQATARPLAWLGRRRADGSDVSLAARITRPILPFLVLVALWQASTVAFHMSPFLYPPPSDVLASFGTLLAHGVLPAYIVKSITTWGLAVVISIGIVVPFGFLLAFMPTLNRALMPIVRFMTSVAELAWLPLVVLWLGYSLTTVLLVIGYTVFFPVLFNLMLGLRQVPQVMIDASRTLGATRFQLFSSVYLPGSLPALMTGVRTGASYAFRALLAAELFSGENMGLGYMIFASLRDAVVTRTIVGMIVIGVVWLVIDQLFLRPLEAATIERWGVSVRPA
jgi:NitT/TauT family transport system permease protein/taurine transport system permease protein